MPTNDVQHSFEDEVFFKLRKQRNSWATVAICSLVLAGLSIIAFVSVFPLKETIPFVVMVDKTTGDAEKIVQVRPMSISEQEAIVQANLVSYVVDRETYDVTDNEDRILFVLRRSTATAESSLRQIWNSNYQEYPPALYGDDIRILTTIKSVTVLEGGDVARVRFTKTRERVGEPNVERSFVATVGFKFESRTERNLQLVWENPVGFSVNSYRIDAETLQ